MIDQHSKAQDTPERFYPEAGAGAPVLLPHCSAGPSRSYLPLIEDLPADFCAIAPDLLGCGVPLKSKHAFTAHLAVDVIAPSMEACFTHEQREAGTC
jgi:pimeloyl-ACP methyl ester carboxylesterase